MLSYRKYRKLSKQKKVFSLELYVFIFISLELALIKDKGHLLSVSVYKTITDQLIFENTC